MKTCILSMQKVNNMGSVLQSYSLKRMMEELGHTVSFIDIKRIEEDAKLVENVNIFNEGEKRTVGIIKAKKFDRYAINRLRIKRKNARQKLLYKEFRERELGIDPKANDEKYDACVIGSDEVFNICDRSSWGFSTQLFGNVEQAEKVITYAASCGATTYERLNVAVVERLKQTMAKLSAVSVRDENTRTFVSNLVDTPITLSLDPVVVGDFSAEIEKAVLPKLPERYCIVYSYYNRMTSPQEIREIKRICKKHHLEIISVGAPQMWIKKHYPMSPFACLKAFAGAEFVVTDTFHGTIFSTKYAKRFATMVRPSNQNKLTDLIKRLGIEEHLLQDISQVDRAYDLNDDLADRQQRLLPYRVETMDYLRANL